MTSLARIALARIALARIALAQIALARTMQRRMRWGRSLAALLLLCALTCGPAGPAQAGPADPRLRTVQKELRIKLHELASWCTAPKLFGSRYDLYEMILGLWPDDEVARKWNGYGDGNKPKKRPGNLSRSGKPALREWQTRIAEWYVGAVEEALAGAPQAERAAQQGAAVRLAVTLAPDHKGLRERNGEVPGKVKGRKTKWILIETQRSRKRRPELRKAAKAALRAVKKPVKCEPRDIDLHSSVTWTYGFKGARGRIFGTMDAEEIRQTLVNAEAALAFAPEALGLPAKRISGLTLYSFDVPTAGNAFLAGQPDVSQSYLKFVHMLAALWIPKTSRVIIKTTRPIVRLEAGARQVTSSILSRGCGITAKQGWAMEGFALHLTWHITQTRRLNSVRQSQYGEKEEAIPDLSKRLKDDGTDWMAEGRKLMASRNAPDLRLVLGKTVNTLTPEDILYGYVLAVFLLEGHKDVLADLLRDIAEVTDANYDAVFGEHLGLDVSSVEQRVKRWAAETHDLK